jgi:hypothetical protein
VEEETQHRLQPSTVLVVEEVLPGPESLAHQQHQATAEQHFYGHTPDFTMQVVVAEVERVLGDRRRFQLV